MLYQNECTSQYYDQTQLNEKPIVNQKQRLKLYDRSIFKYLYFYHLQKKKEKKIENRQDRVKRNIDSPSDKLVFATNIAKATTHA